MIFLTNLRTAVREILIQTNTLSVTTYTSEVKTIKLTSAHLDQGIPNREMTLHDFNLAYVPSGNDSMRVAWRIDNQATQGFTLSLNPFTYGLLGTNSTESSFTMADNQADTTATDLVDKEDIYYHNKTLYGKGKVVEFTITSSGQVDNHIVGMDIGVKVGDQGRAYVGESS
jgi:hypothetical protein